MRRCRRTRPGRWPGRTPEAPPMNRADAPAADVRDDPGRKVEDEIEDDGDMAAQARFALETLAELDGGNGVSLPRLAKRTGLRVSVLLRLYTLMSDARVGDAQ